MERLPEEIPPILARYEGDHFDLFNLTNRRIHKLSNEIEIETGVRVRPFDLWRYASISMHGIASNPEARGCRADYSREYSAAAAELEAKLGRAPQTCEIYIRVYKRSIVKFFRREAREMSKWT